MINHLLPIRILFHVTLALVYLPIIALTLDPWGLSAILLLGVVAVL